MLKDPNLQRRMKSGQGIEKMFAWHHKMNPYEMAGSVQMTFDVFLQKHKTH